MESLGPLGPQITIRLDNQVATINKVGAGLYSYTVDGKPIADGPSAPNQLADLYKGSRGHLLAPWPNRIADGRYEVDNTTLQLPINEVGKGHASHGFVRVFEWEITSQSESAVTLAATFPPQVGYPFAFSMELTYSINADGLTVEIKATNNSEIPMPFGVGMHPYFTAGNHGIDDCTLTLDAQDRLEYNDRSIPTGALGPVAGTPLDTRTGTSLAGLELDLTYTTLRRDDNGIARATISSPSASTTVWMDESFDYVVVFTGDTLTNTSDRRQTLAIEPLSCAPDAFNNGLGLRTLKPNETFSATWGVTHSAH